MRHPICLDTCCYSQNKNSGSWCASMSQASPPSWQMSWGQYIPHRVGTTSGVLTLSSTEPCQQMGHAPNKHWDAGLILARSGPAPQYLLPIPSHFWPAYFFTHPAVIEPMLAASIGPVLAQHWADACMPSFRETVAHLILARCLHVTMPWWMVAI